MEDMGFEFSKAPTMGQKQIRDEVISKVGEMITGGDLRAQDDLVKSVMAQVKAN